MKSIRYEYKVITGYYTTNEIENKLNQLAQYGWEPISFLKSKLSHTVVLKRPKENNHNIKSHAFSEGFNNGES